MSTTLTIVTDQSESLLSWNDPAIELWLTSADAHLDGARTIDGLASNKLKPVIEAIDVEVAGGAQ